MLDELIEKDTYEAMKQRAEYIYTGGVENLDTKDLPYGRKQVDD